MVVVVLRQSFLIAPGSIVHRARFHRSSRRSLRQFVVRSACLRRWSLSFELSCRRSSFMLALGSNQLRDIRGRSMCRDQEIRMCIK